MWSLYILLNKFLKTDEDNIPSSDGEYYNGILPRSHIVEVPHLNQECDWDCGLACVLMVLTTIGNNKCSSIQELGQHCCTTSIWTVDLAYLLQKFGVNFSYYTVTLGANPKFSLEAFYKEQLADDLVRVDMLFQNAIDAGIDIQRRSISEREISLFILSGKYIAIVLVDQHKLGRSRVKSFHYIFCSRCWLDELCGPGLYGNNNLDYTGHYIVICGYDAITDEFEFRDPANSEKHLKLPSKRLEEARKSFGTDEDLLLISLEKNSTSEQLFKEFETGL